MTDADEVLDDLRRSLAALISLEGELSLGDLVALRATNVQIGSLIHRRVERDPALLEMLLASDGEC